LNEEIVRLLLGNLAEPRKKIMPETAAAKQLIAVTVRRKRSKTNVPAMPFSSSLHTGAIALLSSAGRTP